MKLLFALQFNNNPNFFIEKIWQGLLENELVSNDDYFQYKSLYLNSIKGEWDSKNILKPKLHTIRRGDRWAIGMPIEFTIETLNCNFFNFAPEISCITVQKIEISYTPTFQVSIDGRVIDDKAIKTLAINDGFEDVNEFKVYFNNDFNGQIVHWINFRY